MSLHYYLYPKLIFIPYSTYIDFSTNGTNVVTSRRSFNKDRMPIQSKKAPDISP